MEQKESQQNAGENIKITDINNNIEKLKNTVVTVYEGSDFAHMTFKKYSTIDEVVELLLNPTEEDLKKGEELKGLYEAKSKAECEGKSDEAKELDEEYKSKKACYFSSIAFAGKFEGTTCRKEGFIQSSNLVVLDFDHIDEDKLEEFYKKIKEDKHCLFVYKTASGSGLRVGFICHFSDEASYNRAWLTGSNYIIENYAIKADEGAKNINRIMKLNPNGFYVNWDAVGFENTENPTHDVIEDITSKKTARVVSDGKNIDPKKIPSYVAKTIENQLTCLNETNDGERNDKLNKVAYSLGQLEHYKLYDEAELHALVKEICISIGLKENEIENTFYSGWNNGKKNPVYLYMWEAGRND